MPRIRLPLLAALLLGTFVGQAGARTLTAADGRSIEAEVLGFEGADKVRIKRTDTSQIFTLPIDSFAEADRKALRAEAREAATKTPPAPKAGDIVVELSRVRFDTRKTAEDLPLVGGGTARKALVTTEDDWGYSITLLNRTGSPIENLRGECVLYVKVDALKNTDAKPRIRRQAGTVKFDTLPASGRITARSEPITTRKIELKGNVKWQGTGDTKTRDTLEGIALRIYQGNELVLETASPSTIADDAK